MAAVMAEKVQCFSNPSVEAARRVTRDFAYDVLAIFEPLQLTARRRRPDRFFALFAVITVTHRDSRS